MVDQESLKNLHETMDEEADETLSLSDLPLYGDQSVEEWEEEDLSSQSQGSSSISSSDQDYFEFFTHQLSPSATAFPPENFIFCGKLIPYKKPETSQNVPSKAVESKKPTRGIFGWKFSFNRSSNRQVQSENSKKSTTLMHEKDDPSKKKCNRKQHRKGYGFPLRKMPMLTSTSSGKARWYLFLFGVSRFSSGMDLRDIKSSQSRRDLPPSPATSPTTSPTLRLLNHLDDKVSGRTNRALSGLIRVLSCGGNHYPSTMVAQSIRHNRLE